MAQVQIAVLRARERASRPRVPFYGGKSPFERQKGHPSSRRGGRPWKNPLDTYNVFDYYYTMTKAFLYLRTSGDDRQDKAGIPVQRTDCTAFADGAGYQIAQEFVDDGITGKLPMHARPQGKLLISALLADGVKTVLAYDAKRIGRTQPAFWSFIGMCRDNGITVLDAQGTDLGSSVMGGVNGMLAEMDRDATVARLAAGKNH